MCLNKHKMHLTKVQLLKLKIATYISFEGFMKNGIFMDSFTAVRAEVSSRSTVTTFDYFCFGSVAHAA